MIIPTAKLPRRRQKGGFILVLVLGVLILITLLVVSFLGHGLAQVKSVASYRAQTDSLLYSDVAVNLVKAQIDDATSLKRTIWASQPGALRVFTNAGSDANVTTGTVYKLYSSSVLTSSNPATDIPNDLPSTTNSTDWNNSPYWTDLNAPVQKSDGTYAYPIIDAYNDPSELPGAQFSTSSAMSPSFSITSNGVGATSPLVTTTTPSTLYPVPMPVQWLYILKQGQIIAPDANSASSTATVATFNTSVPKPTTINPIVGRVAFWTDDDTCRVNINTASINGTGSPSTAGGPASTSAINTFSDTPHFTAPDDFSLATYQPYTLEYQRYAGHPAMTTLALALPEYADPLGSGNVSLTNMNSVLALTPRYNTGGSNGATTLSTSQSALAVKANSNGAPYRLYDSVDELLFNPPAASPPRSSSSDTSGLTRQQLETAKFFLTAHSRAPELNLFGLPRVAIWPISSSTGTQYRTATDNLIAFCATNNTSSTNAGEGTYYFTREPFVWLSTSTGSDSTTADVNLPRNVSLLSYLDTLTSSSFPVPGYVNGADTYFDAKYTQLGMRQILTEIFDYIRITNSRDPGLDPTLGAPTGATPYAAPTAYDPANLESANGYGQILPTYYAAWGTHGFGRFQGTLVGAQIIFMGVGQGPAVSSPQTWTSYDAVNPYNIYSGGGNAEGTAPGPAPGLGSETGSSTTPTIDYSPLTTGTDSGGYNPNNPAASTSSDTPAGTAPARLIPNPGVTAVEAVLGLTFFDPAMGYARCTEWLHPNTSGLTSLQVTSSAQPTAQTLFAGGDLGVRLGNQTGWDYNQFANANPGTLGGLFDFRFALANRIWGQTTDVNFCGGHSTIINMPTGGTFNFLGGTFTVNAYWSYGPGTDPLIRSYTLNWPAASLPVPAYSTRPIMGSGSDAGDRFSLGNVESTTAKDAGGYLCNFIDFANDTIISMVPNATGGYGDYRMLGDVYPNVVPATAFVAHPNYNNLSQSSRIALDSMYTSGQVFQANTTYAVPTHGVLVSGASYYQTDTSMAQNLFSAAPIVPITQTTAPTANGSSTPDFDNGFGDMPDGPYINKPDEGGVYPTALGSAKVYYDNYGLDVASTASPAFFFSPQRQIPSPVMFGSLPTGAPVNGSTPTPWQTLLFQPGASGHFGLTNPKDEYLLDLFWMPQCLPYALSEPFSTAGKVNLNYQIFPFTYIDRSTAIQSVLASEKVAQIPLSAASTYKNYTSSTGAVSTSSGMSTNARVPLNLSENGGTLGWFVNKFSQWTVFKSAAEICDCYFVPQGQSWTTSTAQSQWYGSGYALVGDNTREKPYADVYSRLTTKSNVYTVYYRVQTLKNVPTTTPTTWTEGTGAITGEFRGSTTIERYLDPNQAIPDFPTLNSSGLKSDYQNGLCLDGFTALGGPLYYKWRVDENDRFAP